MQEVNDAKQEKEQFIKEKNKGPRLKKKEQSEEKYVKLSVKAEQMDYILASLHMVCREDVKSGRNWQVFYITFSGLFFVLEN